MAIQNPYSIGTFAPSLQHNHNQLCRDSKSKLGNKTIYNRDCRYYKEDPVTIVKWLRRNFGERHQGWDFSMISGMIVIEIWDSKLEFMYEMWKT